MEMEPSLSGTSAGYVFPNELYYERDTHLWVRVHDGRATVGVDALGQAAMGDVVHVQIEPVGKAVRRGDVLGWIEAAKMVSPIPAPVSGTIVGVNEAVLRNPVLVNEDPYGGGWLVELEPADWAGEVSQLAHGEAQVAPWVQGEIARYRAQGWIA